MASIVSVVLNAISAKQQTDIKNWEEEVMACEHSLTLEQFEPMSNGTLLALISFYIKFLVIAIIVINPMRSGFV